MSDKDIAKQIIDSLPDYKVSKILYILKGIQIDDEIEDDLFCERLLDEYLDDTDPHKHDTISLEDLAKREGVSL